MVDSFIYCFLYSQIGWIIVFNIHVGCLTFFFLSFGCCCLLPKPILINHLSDKLRRSWKSVCRFFPPPFFFLFFLNEFLMFNVLFLFIFWYFLAFVCLRSDFFFSRKNKFEKSHGEELRGKLLNVTKQNSQTSRTV